MLRISRLVFLPFLLSTVVFSQQPKSGIPVIALKVAYVVDARGGRVNGGQTVLISGDRIQRVGPSTEVAVPSGAMVIDLGSATLLPGLIDCHTHLT